MLKEKIGMLTKILIDYQDTVGRDNEVGNKEDNGVEECSNKYNINIYFFLKQ